MTIFDFSSLIKIVLTFSQNEHLEAVSQGARLLVGGKRYIHPKYPNGHYFTPTLLVDVLPFMKISQQEVFAPVMTVMKFDLLSEAIILANGTKYGLGASVFGRSKEDCRYVVKRLNVGMVCTNGSSFISPSLTSFLSNPDLSYFNRFRSILPKSIPPIRRM